MSSTTTVCSSTIVIVSFKLIIMRENTNQVSVKAIRPCSTRNQYSCGQRIFCYRRVSYRPLRCVPCRLQRVCLTGEWGYLSPEPRSLQIPYRRVEPTSQPRSLADIVWHTFCLETDGAILYVCYTFLPVAVENISYCRRVVLSSTRATFLYRPAQQW